MAVSLKRSVWLDGRRTSRAIPCRICRACTDQLVRANRRARATGQAGRVAAAAARATGDKPQVSAPG